MFAVVEIAGKQYKVAKDDTLIVPSLKEKTGDTVSFDHVLLLERDKGITLGNPFIAGVKVQAKVLDPARGEKVIVFKKKKRKGYRVKNGHRQEYSKVQITNIG